MQFVELRRLPMGNNDSFPELYYPRLQVNKRGEIVLVTNKVGQLSRGVLVGKTSSSKSTLTIGCTLSDWEVAGDLYDYDGEVSITLKNQIIK